MRGSLLIGGVLAAGLSFGVPLINGDLSVGVMNHSPSGYIQYPTGTGDTVDLEDTLGLESKVKPFARAKIEIPIVPNLYLQYIPMSFEGTGRYSTTLTFGDVDFQANVDLDTYVKVDHYDVGLYYNLPLVGAATAGLLDPEVGINVRILDLEGRVTGTESGTGLTRTESVSETVPVPMGYVSLGVNLPVVSFIGELRGITYSGSYYYDLTAEVRAKPLSIPALAGVFVGAGYRYEVLKLDDVGDLTAEIKVSSLFANVGVSF